MPGSEQQYNGLNSIVLGLIVEKVPGHSFTDELAPDHPAAAPEPHPDNTNCGGQDACYSIGGDNGILTTRDLRHRMVYSLNPAGTGNDLPYIKALVSAALAD